MKYLLVFLIFACGCADPTFEKKSSLQMQPTTELHFRDKVLIKSGFYKGSTGEVRDFEVMKGYLIFLNDDSYSTVWIKDYEQFSILGTE